jgi:proteasome lid subunit RPN8/RPN11
MEKQDIESALELLVRLSATVNRELGTCVCKCDDALELDGLSIGDESHVNVACNCTPCSIHAVFHTHIKNPTKPSSIDIKAAVDKGIDIICIGSLVDNKPTITCYNTGCLKNAVEKSS